MNENISECTKNKINCGRNTDQLKDKFASLHKKETNDLLLQSTNKRQKYITKSQKNQETIVSVTVSTILDVAFGPLTIKWIPKMNLNDDRKQ